jgi:hypothetical protein
MFFLSCASIVHVIPTFRNLFGEIAIKSFIYALNFFSNKVVYTDHIFLPRCLYKLHIIFNSLYFKHTGDCMEFEETCGTTIAFSSSSRSTCLIIAADSTCTNLQLKHNIHGLQCIEA